MRLASLSNAVRLGGRLSRRAAATSVATLAVLAVGAAAIGWGVASADDDKLVGKAVPARYVAAITSAATSCPILTAPRLAGQLMAESGLNPRAERTASGGRGIAGLTDAGWKRWAPWPNAPRLDVEANVVALAHQMCDLSGQVRLASLPGDQWRLTVAAFRSGLDPVRKARGVPKAAADYVEKTDGYAAYYASLPYLGDPGPGASVPPQTPDDARPIPDEYVEPLVKAGKVCPKVTAAAVAGQIMALSGFNPNKLGSAGEQGIAQFRPEIWQRYAPGGASPWDAGTAIPAVGTAMCGMVTEFSGLDGDPYLLALAAFKVGTNAVRRGDGSPQAATTTYLERVAAYSAYYRLDTRLSAVAPPVAAPSSGSPASSGAPPPLAARQPAGKPAQPPANGGSQPKPQAKAATTKATTKAAQPAPLPGVSFVQKMSGKCIDAGAGTDGTKLTMRKCSALAAQRWEVRDDGTIRSLLSGLCLDVAWGDTKQGTPVQVANCSGNPAQQWTVGDDMIRTGLAGNCIDSAGDSGADGTALEMITCQSAGHGQQTWRRKK